MIYIGCLSLTAWLSSLCPGLLIPADTKEGGGGEVWMNFIVTPYEGFTGYTDKN